MQAVSIGVVALAVFAQGALAAAAERQGLGAAARTSDRVIALKDGTRLWPAQEISVQSLREGVTVTLAYEKRDGKHVVTRVETAE